MPTPDVIHDEPGGTLPSTSLVLGTPTYPVSVAHVPAVFGAVARLPIVMIHGGFHTGQAYLETPDGRAGWAHLFALRGHDVYVPDWPCHGRSPGLENITSLSTNDIATALASVVAAVGPALLLAHSAGGPLAWSLAERLPAQVCAVIGVAPGAPANRVPVLPDDALHVAALASDAAAGCPVYSVLDKPVTATPAFVREFWANAPRFPQHAFDRYVATVVPESPIVLNERFNIGGKGLALRDRDLVAARPILVVTGEHDARHPKPVDQALATYLNADFIWLPDLGICDNGHMLMIENNSHEIAQVLFDWLQGQGF
jgi:pimeloyl-ACP methyl ester carboxylesterase